MELLEPLLNLKSNPAKEPLEPGVRTDIGDIEHSDADLCGDVLGDDDDDDANAVLSRRRDCLGWRILAGMLACDDSRPGVNVLGGGI